MRGEQKHRVFDKKNTSLLGLLNDELKMNQIKVFLLCFKKKNKSHVSNEHQLLFQR